MVRRYDARIVASSRAAGVNGTDARCSASIDGAIASMLKDGTYDRIAKPYFDFDPSGD
ncbi:hypothetical protein [Burkholderia sp. Bp9140]|uniref:hypothetical protein n=1 Tax=Burkholderia sp. Bp9140 TaxID=2184572 RepID=UPI0021AB0F08|nr:hypothetical protein [Burkholderia sp. Bp9140]